MSKRHPLQHATQHAARPMLWLSLVLVPLIVIVGEPLTHVDPGHFKVILLFAAVVVGAQVQILRMLGAARVGEREAQVLARLDPLTRLGNRRAMADDLDREARRASRTNQNAALVMMDMDGFKQVNDIHGHAHGDIILRVFGDTARAQLRDGIDQAYRYGGDEFVLLLPETSVDEAAAAAERITTDFVQAAKRLTPDLRIGCSYGVEALNTADWRHWLDLADRRMYARKARTNWTSR